MGEPARGAGVVSSRRLDVICLGRAAVDLYGEQIGSRLEDMRSLAKYLGGSSANMAVGMARQGLRSAMLTRVGDEHMGRFVREELARNGVDVSHVHTDPDRLTGLVLLGIKGRDDFPLIFYRENCADMALSVDDFDEGFIASARALAITGTHFSTPTSAAACRQALDLAHRCGTRRVLDIDYRPVLWGVAGHGQGADRFVSSAAVTSHLQSIIPEFELVVGTEEEIHIAAGCEDTLESLLRLRELTDAVLVVKRGPLGCVVFPARIPEAVEQGISVPGVNVEVLNVLGAGDAFISGFLRGWINNESWEQCCRYANACGALVVSRHGCAPAIPSRFELDDYLDRSGSVARPDLDARLNQLHRSTLRRQQWGDIYALAFDHRVQFEEMAQRDPSSAGRISQLKQLIADAMRRATERGQLQGQVGILVDGRFGQQVLDQCTGQGLWIGRPVELPQSRPLQFEAGNNLSAELRSWPSEHIVKCLVYYHPDDGVGLRAEQDMRLRDLFHACRDSGHELLLEVIPPASDQSEEGVLAGAMRAIYALDIFPDWWKLPPPTAAEWPQIAALIDEFDPWCHGVLLLGLNRPAAELVAGFRAAAGRQHCRGFAIGRSLFVECAERWLLGEMGDEALIELVADNFLEMVSEWRKCQPYNRARAREEKSL